MQITAIPRTAFTTTLDLMRLPLSTFEHLIGQTGNEAWPPALLFEEFQAEAKKFTGALWRDDVLVHEGRAQAAKVGELRRAVELQRQAEAVRSQADADLAAKRQATARERQRVEQETAAREAAIARETRAREQRVEAEAERAAAEVAKIDAAREERVAAADREARLAKADAESAALAKQQRAVAAIDTVETLADAVETKKAQRKRN